MKYLLQRDFSVLGRLFKRDALGTEIPAELDGFPIVLFEDWDKSVNQIPLPNEATVFDPANPGARSMSDLIVKNVPDKPIALSQLPKSPSPEEMLEKKKA